MISQVSNRGLFWRTTFERQRDKSDTYGHHAVATHLPVLSWILSSKFSLKGAEQFNMSVLALRSSGDQIDAAGATYVDARLYMS